MVKSLLKVVVSFAFIGVALFVLSGDWSLKVVGEKSQVNEAVVADPSLVNTDPEGAGWFFKIKVSNAGAVAALHDEAAYKAMIA